MMYHWLPIAALGFICAVIGASVSTEDTKCEHPEEQIRKAYHCCKLPYSDSAFDVDLSKEAMAKCSNKYFTKHLKPRHKGDKISQEECTVECMFEELNWLTEDRKINETLMGELVDKSSMPSDWKETWKKLVPVCIEKIEDELRETSRCRSGASRFFECMWLDMFMNCPENRWTESDACEKSKEFLQKCPQEF